MPDRVCSPNTSAYLSLSSRIGIRSRRASSFCNIQRHHSSPSSWSTSAGRDSRDRSPVGTLRRSARGNSRHVGRFLRRRCVRRDACQRRTPRARISANDSLRARGVRSRVMGIGVSLPASRFRSCSRRPSRRLLDERRSRRRGDRDATSATFAAHQLHVDLLLANDHHLAFARRQPIDRVGRTVRFLLISFHNFFSPVRSPPCGTLPPSSSPPVMIVPLVPVARGLGRRPPSHLPGCCRGHRSVGLIFTSRSRSRSVDQSFCHDVGTSLPRACCDRRTAHGDSWRRFPHAGRSQTPDHRELPPSGTSPQPCRLGVALRPVDAAHGDRIHHLSPVIYRVSPTPGCEAGYAFAWVCSFRGNLLTISFPFRAVRC